MKKLTENLRQNWPTYFFEIFVLIIGIYGAFALENWRDEVNNQKQILQSIHAIAKDLQTDTAIIEQTNFYLIQQINSGRSIIPILESEKPIIKDSLAFIISFNHFTGAPIIGSRNSTWENMNVSGRSMEIKDQVLMSLLREYYLNYHLIVENYNQSAIPPRLQIRQLKYELFDTREHEKFFPTKTPVAPSAEVYEAILSDPRILPLCRFIGGGSAIYFETSFNDIKQEAISILQYIQKNYPS